MVKLHLELEGDVGEVVRVLRRLGGGDNAGGEVRDGPRPAPTEERTSAVYTVPEPGTTATSAALAPGRWTEELAADFTAGLDVGGQTGDVPGVAGGRKGHPSRTHFARRTDLTPVELRSLLIRMGHALGRFQRERGLALSRPVAANSPLQSYFIDPDFAAVAASQICLARGCRTSLPKALGAPLMNACHWAPGRAKLCIGC